MRFPGKLLTITAACSLLGATLTGCGLDINTALPFKVLPGSIQPTKGETAYPSTFVIDGAMLIGAQYIDLLNPQYFLKLGRGRIYLPLEDVEPAQFSLPDPKQNGDYRSCRLLRDAVIVVMGIRIHVSHQRGLQRHAAVVEDLDSGKLEPVVAKTR